MRKPRSDSKLLVLPEEQQLQIFNWLKEVGYTETKLIILKKFNISTSAGALNNFWGHWCKKESEQRMLKMVSASNAIIESSADNLPTIDKAMEAALKQAAFEAALSGDNEAIKTLVELTLKVNKASMAEDKLQFEIEKFKSALKTKQEIALDAIFEDIKGNPAAEALFVKMRDALAEVSNG